MLAAAPLLEPDEPDVLAAAPLLEPDCVVEGADDGAADDDAAGDVAAGAEPLVGAVDWASDGALDWVSEAALDDLFAPPESVL